MEIIKWQPYEKGMLKGYFTLKIPKWGGFCIQSMSYFSKNEKQRWISFPSKMYEAEGEKKYAQYCFFEDAVTIRMFQESVLKALDAYFTKNAPSVFAAKEATVASSDQAQPIPF